MSAFEPLIGTGSSTSKSMAPLALFHVSSSTRMPVLTLLAISLALMLTSLPYSVYSARSAVPTVPQNTLPVVMPTRIS